MHCYDNLLRCPRGRLLCSLPLLALQCLAVARLLVLAISSACVLGPVPCLVSLPHCCSYAKWCGVCKMVQPEYVSAAWKAFNISFGAKFGRVDVDKQKDLTDRYGVTSFPTFFFFRNGEPEPFPMLMTDNAYIAGETAFCEWWKPEVAIAF